MVNELHLYSAFTDPMAIKALYILPHIHPFTLYSYKLNVDFVLEIGVFDYF